MMYRTDLTAEEAAGAAEQSHVSSEYVSAMTLLDYIAQGNESGAHIALAIDDTTHGESRLISRYAALISGNLAHAGGRYMALAHALEQLGLAAVGFIRMSGFTCPTSFELSFAPHQGNGAINVHRDTTYRIGVDLALKAQSLCDLLSLYCVRAANALQEQRG